MKENSKELRVIQLGTGGARCSLLLDKELLKNATVKTTEAAVDKPKHLGGGEWLYKGCFIQESEHPQLIGKYEVFKNDEPQSHVGRCYTFTEAKRLCEENECFDNILSF